MEKLTLTVEELKEAMGCGRRQAYDLVNRSDFPKIRLGKRILIPRAAFMRWLEAQTENAS